MSGEPYPSNIKIYLNNIEHNIVKKHGVYSDRHLGAGHPILGSKGVKFLKICTIILISMMSLTLKVLISSVQLNILNFKMMKN